MKSLEGGGGRGTASGAWRGEAAMAGDDDDAELDEDECADVPVMADTGV
jgi:hypothetical protein